MFGNPFFGYDPYYGHANAPYDPYQSQRRRAALARRRDEALRQQRRREEEEAEYRRQLAYEEALRRQQAQLAQQRMRERARQQAWERQRHEEAEEARRQAHLARHGLWEAPAPHHVPDWHRGSDVDVADAYWDPHAADLDTSSDGPPVRRHGLTPSKESAPPNTDAAAPKVSRRVPVTSRSASSRKPSSVHRSRDRDDDSWDEDDAAASMHTSADGAGSPAREPLTPEQAATLVQAHARAAAVRRKRLLPTLRALRDVEGEVDGFVERCARRRERLCAFAAGTQPWPAEYEEDYTHAHMWVLFYEDTMLKHMLALDNIQSRGVSMLRQRRKALVTKVQQLTDWVDPVKKVLAPLAQEEAQARREAMEAKLAAEEAMAAAKQRQQQSTSSDDADAASQDDGVLDDDDDVSM